MGLDSDPLAWSVFGANDKPKKNDAGGSAQENNTPAINTNEDDGSIAASWRQHSTSANNSASQEPAGIRRAESMSVLDHVQNTAMQSNRFLPGVAQGVLKIFAAPGIALESLPQGIKDFLHINGASASPPGGHADLNLARPSNAKPITEAAKALNTGIQNYTDSFVPAPISEAAKFTATVADAAGEAVPAAAAAAMTGGASAVLTGTALSYGLAGASGFSTEMLEGSGDAGRAIIAGGVEAGTEALGGVAAKYGGKVVSRIADSPMGEGVEEVLAGSAQARLNGEQYSLKQARDDYLVGSAVGRVIGGGATAVNTLFGAPTNAMNDSAATMDNPSGSAISNSEAAISNTADNTFGYSSDSGSIDPYEEFFDASNDYDGFFDISGDYDGGDIGEIDPYYAPKSWKVPSTDTNAPTDARSNTSVTGTRTATMDTAALLNELSSNPILVDNETWARINEDLEPAIQPAVPESVPEPEPEFHPQPEAPPTINPEQTPKTIPTNIPEEVPIEAPTQTPAEIPAQTPVEVPTQTPVEIPTQTPVEVPTQPPVEVPNHPPVNVPTQTPVEIPTHTPTPTPTPVPQQTPTNTSTQVQTATQEQEQTSEVNTKRKDKNTQSDPSLMGSGATGEVYESTTYNLTFGAGILSSN